MFQLNLLNSHIQHIIICLYICFVTHSKSSDLHKFTVHKSSWHEIQKTSEGWKCLLIKIYQVSSLYNRQNTSTQLYLFTSAFLLHSWHYTSSLTYSQTLHNPEKNYYRMQLHLPLILNCMTLLFGEFIKSCCKQCFIWARVVEGIPHTAVCTWWQIHTVSRVRSMNTFKILKINTY